MSSTIPEEDFSHDITFGPYQYSLASTINAIEIEEFCILLPFNGEQGTSLLTKKYANFSSLSVIFLKLGTFHV
jgi:hypothetical protein